MCDGVNDKSTVDVFVLFVPFWSGSLWREHVGYMCGEGRIFNEFGNDIRSCILWVEEEGREYESLICLIFRIEFRLVGVFREFI